MIESLSSVQFRSAGKIDAQLDLLTECLEALSAEKRELLIQCYSYHGALKDLARRLKIETDTLYKRVERIRKTLFNCIEKGK